MEKHEIVGVPVNVTVKGHSSAVFRGCDKRDGCSAASGEAIDVGAVGLAGAKRQVVVARPVQAKQEAAHADWVLCVVVELDGGEAGHERMAMLRIGQ